MPRVTRAALRSQSNNEESDSTSTAPLPASTRRLPLGETDGNQGDRSSVILNPEKVTKALNKGIVKGKKSKALNKAKENVAPVRHQDNGDIVLKDDYESETSSAVDEACQSLISPENEGTLLQLSLALPKFMISLLTSSASSHSPTSG